MIKNRPLSFIILFLVYALALAGGIIVYQKLNYSYQISMLIADVVATVIVFIFSLIFKNASVYDPYWSVQPIVIVGIVAGVGNVNLLGILLLVAICYWGIRLTANWAYTFRNLTEQDWRYTLLHEKTGIFYPFINFIGIHMVPTFIVYFCILPAIVAIKEDFQFNPLCLVFFALALTAATIQLFADIQMQRYRNAKAQNKLSPEQGNFIRTGLWKHGRHPNYFSEILMWWSIGLTVVCANPSAWYLLAGAFANTVLFSCVSIPMAEKRQSKKSGFADYKKQTRLFI